MQYGTINLLWHYVISRGINVGLYAYITSLGLSLPPLYLLIYMFVIIQRFHKEIEIEKVSNDRSYTLGVAPSQYKRQYHSDTQARTRVSRLSQTRREGRRRHLSA